jgi:hypothetical protein
MRCSLWLLSVVLVYLVDADGDVPMDAGEVCTAPARTIAWTIRAAPSLLAAVVVRTRVTSRQVVSTTL